MLSSSLGGLLIRNLRYFNEALLGKWLWRFGYEREALWRRVIRVKYRVKEGDWCSNSIPSSYGVSLWKTITSGWSTFSPTFSFRLEMGLEWNFGMMSGVGIILWVCVFQIYSKDKEAYVADLMQFSKGVLFWDLEFLREIHEGIRIRCLYFGMLYMESLWVLLVRIRCVGRARALR